MPQSRQIVIDDLLINYLEASPDSPARGVVVFLHGWRSESRIWYSEIKNLAAAGFRVFAPDLPGFGRSSLPLPNWNVARYADLINQFLDKLNLEAVSLVGHSFGGRLCLKLAATAPARLRQIVLVSAAGLRQNNWRVRLLPPLAKILKPLFSWPFLKNFRPLVYRWLGAGDYLATPSLRPVFLNVINEDLSPLLPKINLPTLIIWGENDQTTPLSLARALRAGLTHSRLVIIPNADHFVFLDQPDRFHHTLLSFLQP